MRGSTKKLVIVKVDASYLHKKAYLLFENILTYVLFTSQTGMSDLCSPMIVLLNDEADAFWCFERLMRRLVYTVSPIVFSVTCFF